MAQGAAEGAATAHGAEAAGDAPVPAATLPDPRLPAAPAPPDAAETVPDTAASVPEGADPPGPLYVVGDVHGYLEELRLALRRAGLTDDEDRWIAGTARLWFLGDFTDRGPDGVGVIDLVRRLSAEAAAAGGYCKALLGNHEFLLLGAYRFGDAPVDSGAGTATFRAAWLLNGGQPSDMERLQEHHVQWMARLDSMAVADGHLLVHSDATAYLDYGDTVTDVNEAVTQALQRQDLEENWELFRKFTKRFAFRDQSGVRNARQLLDTYGGERVVHGHSPIPYLTGEGAGDPDAADEAGRPDVPGPYVYADQLALAMDGGVTMGGPVLVARLPITVS